MTVAQQTRTVKVVVWDLDNTLWDGTLLEGDDVRPRPGVVEALRTLDERGVLHSIASRNEPDHALAKLKELKLDHFFIYPQIGWGSKAEGVKRVAETINIGLDTVCFIDDQPFEREEVAHSYPEVMLLEATEAARLPQMNEMMPRFITDESKIRRQMYQADAQRNQAEETHEGVGEEFLATLGMVFTIGPCAEEDLKRAEELTVRTNQLNATGYTYSYEELDALRHSDQHLLLVASLTDKYGPYGKIGLALVEKGAEAWTLKLMLMSCRVMARGVGTVLLNHIHSLARDAGKPLIAEFKPTDRNRQMKITYMVTGFKDFEERDGIKLLKGDPSRIQPFPDYVDVRIEA